MSTMNLLSRPSSFISPNSSFLVSCLSSLVSCLCFLSLLSCLSSLVSYCVSILLSTYSDVSALPVLDLYFISYSLILHSVCTLSLFGLHPVSPCAILLNNFFFWYFSWQNWVILFFIVYITLDVYCVSILYFIFHFFNRLIMHVMLYEIILLLFYISVVKIAFSILFFVFVFHWNFIN